jgi:hypothetical protein
MAGLVPATADPEPAALPPIVEAPALCCIFEPNGDGSEQAKAPHVKPPATSAFVTMDGVMTVKATALRS